MIYNLYSTKLVIQHGRAVRLVAYIQAQEDWGLYANYPYLDVNCTRDERACRNLIGDDCTEWLCRARRTILFADTAGLAARRLTSSDRELIARAIGVVRFDHTSAWSSGYGKGLLLTEPYCYWSLEQFNALREMGIAAIRLPMNLSPYCGRWDPNPGAIPWTYSYLLCDAGASGCLREVEHRLNAAARKAPRWNDISGVRHV